MSVLRDLTQRQFLPMSTYSYSGNKGGLTSFQLPETGLGARLYLNFVGKLNIVLGGGTAILSPLGIRNAASLIRVRLNDGTLLYEMEGFNSRIPNMLQNGIDMDYTPVARSYTSTTPFNAPAPSASLTTQNYDINFTAEIPFMNNDKDMLGLILLQNGSTQATVEITWNQTTGDGISSLVTTTGAATADLQLAVSPTLEFFTLPALNQKDLQAVLLPHLRWTNQWKSEYEAITSTATLKKRLERGSIYTKVAHRFLVNGALNSLVPSNFRILMKGSEVPLSISRDLQLYLQKRNYGFDLPEGLFIHDYDRSFGIEEFGDMRDYVDSRQLTELVSEISYNSGTTFAANSYVYTITNKLTPVSL